MCDLRDIDGGWTPDEPDGLTDSNGSDGNGITHDSVWSILIHRVHIICKFRPLRYLLLMLFSLILLYGLIDQIWSLDPGESVGIVAGISLLVLLVFLYIVNIDVIRTNLTDQLLGKVWNGKSPDSTNDEERINAELDHGNCVDGDFGWMADGDFF